MAWQQRHYRLHAFCAEIARAVDPPPSEHYIAWKKATVREERAAAYPLLTPADHRQIEREWQPALKAIMERQHAYTKERGDQIVAERKHTRASLRERDQQANVAKKEGIARLPPVRRFFAHSTRAIGFVVAGFLTCWLGGIFVLSEIASLWDLVKSWKPLLIVVAGGAALIASIFAIFFFLKSLQVIAIVIVTLPKALAAAARAKGN